MLDSVARIAGIGRTFQLPRRSGNNYLVIIVVLFWSIMLLVAGLKSWALPGPQGPLIGTALGLLATLPPLPLALWSTLNPKRAGWALLIPAACAIWLLLSAEPAGRNAAHGGWPLSDLIVVLQLYLPAPLLLIFGAGGELGGKLGTD